MEAAKSIRPACGKYTKKRVSYRLMNFSVRVPLGDK